MSELLTPLGNLCKSRVVRGIVSFATSLTVQFSHTDIHTYLTRNAYVWKNNNNKTIFRLGSWT